MYDVKRTQTLLPKVGDKRMEVPTIGKTNNCIECITTEPQECVVVEVNAPHPWYRVRFENGRHECYKVPRLKYGKQGRLL